MSQTAKFHPFVYIALVHSYVLNSCALWELLFKDCANRSMSELVLLTFAG